jgi:VWFA-related protein
MKRWLRSFTLVAALLWLTPALGQAPPPGQLPPGPPPPGAPPRSAPPKQLGEEQNTQTPLEEGRTHHQDTDPFLKYDEDVTVQVTHLDLRDFPTVRAYATVHDKAGQQLRTLQEGDFKLSENKVPVDDLHFAQHGDDELPLTILFVVDVSSSMEEGDAITLEKDAIREFVKQLGPKDRVGLITFSDAAMPEVDLTAHKDALLSALDGLTAWGQTALWDGVTYGVEELIADKTPSRKALIVMSDGGDNKSVETPQTIHALYSDKAKGQNDGFPIYALGLGEQADRAGMTTLATLSGGQYIDSPSPQDLSDVYQDILHQIQNEYYLEYTSPTVASPGQIIDIELGLNNVVRSFTPGAYTYRSPGLAAALGRALWPGLVTISVLLIVLIIMTIFKISRKVWLTAMLTPLEGRDYSVGIDQVDIGRSEACNIRISRDPAMQPVHAALRETRDGFVLEAYDPAAPIIFGKQLLAKKLLRNGDAFILGSTSFVFNEKIERPGAGTAEPVNPLAVFAGSAGQGSSSLVQDAEDAPEPQIVQTPPALAGPPSALVALSGPYFGQRFELGNGETVIGRSEGQLVLGNDSQVSRRHSAVALAAGQATVSDLGSTNGTRVNGKPLQPGLAVPLHRGDTLGIGSGEYRVD